MSSKQNVKVVEGDLKLVAGKHFSRSGLAQLLTEKYEKRSGKKFTSRDVQQYALRGNLPTQYGGHPITEIKHSQLGVFVEVDFNE